MSAKIAIIGSFSAEERCAHGIEALREARLAPARVFSPIPSEKIAEALERRPSPVRAVALTGGILGILTAFALTIGTAMEWNLNVDSMPIASIPPYLIIVFELMVLFGGLSAVGSLFFFSGLPALEPIEGYEPRFAEDRFGVLVMCDEADSVRVEALLKEAGADEVTREAA